MNDRHRSVDGTRCRLTRCGFVYEGMPEDRGRPIGTLAAWLEESFTEWGRETHRDPYYVLGLEEKKRQDARERVMCMPCGPQLAEGERPRNLEKNEPEEPKYPCAWW